MGAILSHRIIDRLDWLDDIAEKLQPKLASFGTNLEPGDIVLSGSLGNAIPAQQGDVFVLEAHGQPPLTVSFV